MRHQTIGPRLFTPQRLARCVGVAVSAVVGVVGVLGVLGAASCESVSSFVQDNSIDTKPSGATAAFREEPDIRVRVARAAVEKEIGGPARLIVRPVGSSTSKSKVVPAPVKVHSGAKGVIVTDAKGAKHEWPYGVDVEVLGSDGASDGDLNTPNESLKVEGKRYPGFIAIRPKWNEAASTFDVVVTMPVESYLPGVLTHELLKDWPRQTYEAQAVAARTYALHERERARAEGKMVDVESTTSDQVYGGATPSALANEAVRATRGQVLLCDGKMLRAYFSSQCGGRASSAAVAWPKPEVYEFNRARPLQGKPRQFYCQKSPNFRWEVTRSDDDVNRRLRAWGRANGFDVGSITRVRTIEAVERNEAQRPVRYVVRDDRGREYILRAEELRMALNHPVPDLAPITSGNIVNSGDLEVEVWANQVKIRGRGWGHGVGMCQWCAKGMGDAGMDWHTMVSEFYPGALVKKMY